MEEVEEDEDRLGTFSCIAPFSNWRISLLPTVVLIMI